VTEVELRQLAADLVHAMYWAGPNETDTYELTRTRDGRVYLRYLQPKRS
jgi:DNA primase